VPYDALMMATAFSPVFAGVVNLLSYEFEWRGRYKRFFTDFGKRAAFRQQVLSRGQELAYANGHQLWYEQAGADQTCFWVSEYLHEQFNFAAVGQGAIELLPFTTNDLQVLEEGQALQLFLPFYKIARYREQLAKYLLLEDETTCLFLADGMLRLFRAHLVEYPQWRAIGQALRAKDAEACVLVVAKNTGHLYSPFTPEPIFTN
jgi:hypothetical protein